MNIAVYLRQYIWATKKLAKTGLLLSDEDVCYHLKPISITEKFRETTNLLDFINRGLEKISG